MAKPDLVAPGSRIVSLNDDGSYLANARQADLVAGTHGNAPFLHLTLSGTSMAAPEVTGVVARMPQADPGLTPNGVKALSSVRPPSTRMRTTSRRARAS